MFMKRRVTVRPSGLVVALLPAVLLATVPSPARAIVTYDGDEGVYSDVFSSNSVQACLGCHASYRTDTTDATGTTADDRNGAPVGVNFDTYAWATSGTNEERAVARGVVALDGYMPPNGDLSAAEQSLLLGWQSGSYQQNAAPSASTIAASSVGPYSASLRANVNDNGSNATYDFQYGTQASGTWGTTINSNLTTSGTMGGTSTQLVSYSLTGLSCGTGYQYRGYGTNGVGTTSTGNRNSVNFTTDPCTTIGLASISNKPEATTYTDGAPLADLNVSGGDGTYSYSVVSGSMPAGISINSNGRLVGTTPNLVANQLYSFTIRANDNAGSYDDQAFSFTLTADNDAPTITSPASPTSAIEGTTYPTFRDVNATDPEGQTLTYSLQQTPAAGMTIDSSSGVISWTPPNGVTSVDIVVTVSDGTPANNKTQSWTITVTATNDPPSIINFSPTLTGSEDVQWSYQLDVDDIDDNVAAPGNIFYTLGSAPSGMAVSSLGLITWTPSEAQVNDSGTTAFNNISITVEDGNEDSSTPTAGNNGVKTFSLTISPVNDAPMIGAISNQNVTELSAFTITPSVTDPDDSNDGTNLTWSLSGAPAGMSISNSPGTVGQISYTPGQNVVEPNSPYNTLSYLDFVITVQVDDGHENGVTTATRTLNLRVNKLDAGDDDLVADYRDNCPTTNNADQADNDIADGADGGDVCDTDDDNDGISDVAELANLLDPFDKNDAGLDFDGDGISNYDEFQVCLGNGDADCTDISNSLVTNGDITIVATGPYTPVDVHVLAAYTIENGEQLPLDVSVSDDGPFRPGEHVLTWTATHPYTMAVMATAEQTIRVIPTLSIGGDVITGEGGTVLVPVLLSGDSPAYPVNIDYTVTGTATPGADHNLSSSGTLTITGGTAGLLTLDVLDDGFPELDETVEITLTHVWDDDSAVLSDAVASTITIALRQLAPEVSLWASQDGASGLERRNVMFLDNSDGYVDVYAIDRNGDALTYDWSASDPVLGIGGETGANVAFKVAGVLAAGEYYDAVVRVSDDADPVNTTERRITIYVADTAPEMDPGNVDADTDGDGLADDDPAEGLNDNDGDGIPDYLDPVPVPGVLMVQVDGTNDNLLLVVQAEAGLGLVAGPFAAAAQGETPPSGGARAAASLIVDDSGTVITDEDYMPIGAIYDIVVNANAGTTTMTVIYSLTQPLPPDSVWRVFINGGWFTFVVTADDMLWSAPASADGQCTALDDSSWVSGLVTGYTCVRIVYSDGGPNDSDGMVNASVHVTGGAALSRAVVVVSPPSGEEGSGSSGAWLLLLMSLLGFRVRRDRK